jgi:hypothetical protein
MYRIKRVTWIEWFLSKDAFTLVLVMLLWMTEQLIQLRRRKNESFLGDAQR